MADEVKAIKTDGEILTEDIVRLFHSHFSESLDILSSRFPHRHGDKSQNEADYSGLRAKILRSGNNKLRDLPRILSDYEVVKVRDTVVETKSVSPRTETTKGKGE
jgi:hypothetical protein